MIEAIKEINFPVYATLSQATVVLNDMGDRTITADVKIDGSVIPDFSYDWEVEFKGERYIQPLRKPHAIKDNKSLRSTISLTFYHWAIYQLKRDFFVELASTQAGTAFADKYISPLAVNLGEFITAFNRVLSYYFPDGKIYAVLNPGWEYNLERQYVEINYSYLWDVLQKTHELFNVRWSIEKDDNGNYAIRFGYPAGELTHIFEYGFEGGLLKVERQVQDTNIRNKILGRGGSNNLPYLYFKDYDKYQQDGNGNQGMIPDPDAIPELANIYFTELRDSNFRSYVQGWKSNPNRILVDGDVVEPLDTERAESDYAYMRGATDEKFDPVEYVKDDESIAEYGELVGKIENNEDIFPTLQGAEIEINSPDGKTFLTRADEVVAVEEVTTDAIVNNEDTQAKKTEIESSREFSFTKEPIIDLNKVKTRTFREKLIEFEIPEGKEGFISNIPDIKYDVLLAYDTIISQSGPNSHTTRHSAGNNTISYTYNDKEFPKVQSIQLLDVFNNNTIPLNTKLVSGKYQIEVEIYIPEQELKTGEINRSVSKRGNNIYTTITSISKYNWVTRNIRVSVPITIGSFNGVILFNRDENGIAFSKNIALESGKSETITILGETFSVPEQGAMMVDVPISIDPKETSIFSEKTIKVVNTDTNEIVPATNIPEGNYQLLVETKLSNTANVIKNIAVELLPGFLYFTADVEKWQPTFDVWIKNIFNTKKSDYASEAAYVEGVWSPLRTEDEMVLTFSSGNLSGHDSWEFKIKKDGIAYDNSKTIIDANGNEVRSEWRLTLIKSDAEIETIKKYIPYKDFNAKAGDFFFFTGIFLPHQYILSAEKELTEYKSENLSQTKDIKPQWVVSLDKVRAHRQDAEKIIDQLYVGSVITLKDRRFIKNVGERQILQSITYEWQESSLLPNIDVVLSEKVSTSLSTVAMLQSKVESLAKQVGGISNLEQIIRKVGDLLYLRKDGFADTSSSPTKFADTVSSENFIPGPIGGSGWGAYTDESGRSVIEADKLFIRNEMQVNSLIVNQIAALGGTKILSAADLTISKVETVIMENDVVGDRCFFDTRGGSKANPFAIDDIAYSNMLDSENIELKYYKRRVIEVGPDYITLSTTELDGNGAPQEGDIIVQFGNFTNKARQSFIIIDPLNGGKIEVYAGVNSFSISGCNMIGMGVNPDTNESFLYGYGDMFFGERGGSGHFISFDKSTGKFKIKAEVNFEAGSTGLNNVEGFSEALLGALGGIEVGGQNMLRNSGFTGDYLSEQLADDNVLDATSQMFNPPLVHWDSYNATVQDSTESASGKEVVFKDGGSISQTLYQRMIVGEHYVLSLKAKGEVFTYGVGGVRDEISLSDDWEKFVFDIVPTTSDNVFSLSNVTGTICDVQLERGTIPTAWSNNPLDNNSDRAYYEALKHLDNVLNAVTDATTTVSGGLVLTNQIHVGDYVNKVMKKATGGISGTWNKDDDPFLWGGGNIGEANKAIETDGEEGANFVISHGGKAILNEARVRGHISARSGEIGDFEIAEIDNGMFLKADGDRGNENVSMQLSGYGLQMHAEGGIGESGAPAYRSQSTSYPTREYASIIRNEFTDTGSDDSFMPAPCIALRVSAKGAKSNNNTQSGGNYAILNENGMIGGLRPATMAFTSDTLNLSAQDHTVLLTRGTTVNLPSNPQDGQEYELLCPNTDFADVIVVSSKKMYLFLDGVERTGFSVGELGGTRQVVKIVFCATDGKWFVWHHTY